MMADGEITVYEKAGFGSIRMFVEDGEIHAVASDFAKVLEYSSAKDMIRSLDPDEFCRHIVPTKKGPREVYVINEAGMYHAILMRRSACVRDPEARATVESVQNWVTHEVLPSIRRTGMYVNPRWEPESDEDGMFLMSRAVLYANRKIIELQAENEAMRPMAELGEAVSATSDTIDWSAMANLLTNAGFRIGRNNLLKLLREEKILKSGRDRNLPYQRYIDLGYFEVHESTFEKSDGSTHVTLTTRVTGRGQEFLLRRYAPARTLAVTADA